MTENTDVHPVDPVVARIVERQPIDATVGSFDGRWVLTLTREFPHDAARVWAMLTEPDALRRWSPIVPDRALTTTGPATTQENPDQERLDAEVLVAEEPHLLCHRWGPHILRWILTPTAGGCRLILEQTFDQRSERGSLAAGWHICLSVLVALLDGHKAERVVAERASAYGWSSLEASYRKRV